VVNRKNASNANRQSSMFHSARQIAVSMILAMTMSAMDEVIAEQVVGDSAATADYTIT